MNRNDTCEVCSARFELVASVEDAGSDILSTGEAAGRVLVTRNVKDFPVGMAGVRVPYKI